MLTAGLDNVKTLCKRVVLMDIHPALRILRCSLSSPKFQYLLRACPTFMQSNQLNQIDEFYRQTLEAITNNNINGSSWTQASLPLSFSGLGIRKLNDLAHPAFFASIYQSENLSNKILSKFDLRIINNTLFTLLENYPSDLVPPTSLSKQSQKSWDSLNVKRIFHDLLASSGPLDRARLLASSTKPSSKWLQAVPSQNLGLLLDNDSARIAVGLRLGNKICEPHYCACGAWVEANGHHGLSCNKGKGKYSRHAEINKIISMAFTSAGFPNKVEPYGLSRRDGKRPDGMTNYPWSHGKSLLWDVTVVDTVATSYLHLTSQINGGAADVAEREKHNNCIELKERFCFTPLAFETFGSIGPETDIFIKKLGKLMTTHTGDTRSLDFLMQRISIAIQRGNAISISNTFVCDNENNL